MHEMRRGGTRAQRLEEGQLRRAQPETINRVRGMSDFEEPVARRRVVDVEGQLVVAAERGVEVGQAGDVEERELSCGG